MRKKKSLKKCQTGGGPKYYVKPAEGDLKTNSNIPSNAQLALDGQKEFEGLPIYKNIRSTKSLLNLAKLNGRPEYPFDTIGYLANKSILEENNSPDVSYEPDLERAWYSILSNRMHVASNNDVVSETAHSQQVKRDGKFKSFTRNLKDGIVTGDMFTDNDKRYFKKGSFENEAHFQIEPKLHTEYFNKKLPTTDKYVGKDRYPYVDENKEMKKYALPKNQVGSPATNSYWGINSNPMGSPNYTWASNPSDEDIINYLKDRFSKREIGAPKSAGAEKPALNEQPYQTTAEEYANANKPKQELVEDSSRLGYSKFFQGLNTLLDTTQLVARGLQDAKNSREEREKLLKAQYMNANYNPYETGINNVPVYLASGGSVSVAKAKEILRDGKVHGKPLTAKQKRYFGFIAGGGKPKYQVGGGDIRRMSPIEMQYFNNFNKYVREQGYDKSSKLNNQTLSRQLYKNYQAIDPSVNIPYEEFIPMAQQEQYFLKDFAQGLANRRNDPNAQSIMGNITKFDGMYGPKTNSYDFPNLITNTYHNNNLVSSKDLGLITDGKTTDQAVDVTPTAKTAKRLVVDPTTGYLVERQTGGSVNTTGYLKGAATSKNDFNIIPSQYITTENMAFPIEANGVPLYPNTGNYIIPSNNGMVVEKPLMQSGGSVQQVQGVNINNANAMLEKGEVFQRQQGDIVKVAESEDTHDAKSGGSPQANVERVLEDTSDKRKDPVSKLLKITPEEAKQLFNFKIKRPVSHSKLYEKIVKNDEKELNKLEKTIDKNLEYYQYQHGGIHAKNSLDENLKLLATLPTKQERFDTIYAHQQQVKTDNNIVPTADGKGKIAKYQIGTPDVTVPPVSGRPTVTPKAYRNIYNEWVYNPAFNLQNYQYSDPNTDYQKRISESGDRYGSAVTYNPIHETWNNYYFPGQTLTAKSFQNNYQQHVASPLNQQYVFSSNPAQPMDEKYGNNTYNAPLPGRTVQGRKSGTIDLNTYINTPDKQILADEYGITLEELNKTFDKTTGYNYFLNIGTPQQPAPQPAVNTTGGANVNPNSTRYQLPEEVKASTVNEGLGWSGGYGNLLMLIDSFGRTPVDLEQLNREYYQVHEQDVTPVINANLSDFNAAMAQMPNTGVGFANQANLQAQKYNINNQAIQQVDAANKQRFTARDADVADKKFQLDLVNYQLRDEFRERVLASKEAQRQQKFESLNGLFRAIDERNAFNRNANLALQLTPYFDANGKFNGNKYNISLGLNNDQYESTLETLPNGEQRVITRDKRTGKLVSRSQMQITTK